MSDEMITMFVDEVKLIRGELASYMIKLMKMKEDELDLKLFESYGQAVDRIYGTAATLGHNEVAQYCLALKEVCYQASQVNNPIGHKKAIKMMSEYIMTMGDYTACINDPEKVKSFKLKFLQEVKRAERMNQQEFYSVTKKSCG